MAALTFLPLCRRLGFPPEVAVGASVLHGGRGRPPPLGRAVGLLLVAFKVMSDQLVDLPLLAEAVGWTEERVRAEEVSALLSMEWDAWICPAAFKAAASPALLLPACPAPGCASCVRMVRCWARTPSCAPHE